MLRRSFFIALTILPVGLARPTEAARPWEPKVSVQPAEAIGIRRLVPDSKTLKRFSAEYQRGRQLLSRGHYQKARLALEKAIQLNPDHGGARLEHARVLLTLGYLTWNRSLIEKAYAGVRHALNLEPGDQNLKLMAELIEGLLNRMKITARHTQKNKPR